MHEQRLAKVGTILVAVTLCLLMDVAFGQAPSSITIAGQRYSLSAGDEFDSSIINKALWSFDMGYIANNEKQWYVTDNAGVANGVLSITARKNTTARPGWNYTSTRLNSEGKFCVREGDVFRTRAKVPGGRGVWPAVWLLGSSDIGRMWPENGEIDVMEAVGHEPEMAFQTVHSKLHNHALNNAPKQGTKMTNISTDFHVYELQWSANTGLQFIIDDVHTLFVPRRPLAEDWPFTGRNCYFVIMNVAVGGDWGGERGIDDEGALPATMTVDYVRVYTPVVASGGTLISQDPRTPLMYFSTRKYSVNAFPIDQLMRGLSFVLTPLLSIVSVNNVQVYSVCQESSVTWQVKKASCIHYDNEFYPSGRRLLSLEGDTVVGFRVRHALIESLEINNKVLALINATFAEAARGQGILGWIVPTSQLFYTYQEWPIINTKESGGVVVRVGLLSRQSALPAWAWILITVVSLFLIFIVNWVVRKQIILIREGRKSYIKVAREQEMIRRPSFTINTTFTVHLQSDEPDITYWGLKIQGVGVYENDKVTNMFTPFVDTETEYEASHSIRILDVVHVVHLRTENSRTGLGACYAVYPREALEVWLVGGDAKVRYAKPEPPVTHGTMERRRSDQRLKTSETIPPPRVPDSSLVIVLPTPAQEIETGLISGLGSCAVSVSTSQNIIPSSREFVVPAPPPAQETRTQETRTPQRTRAVLESPTFQNVTPVRKPLNPLDLLRDDD